MIDLCVLRLFKQSNYGPQCGVYFEWMRMIRYDGMMDVCYEVIWLQQIITSYLLTQQQQ